MTGKKYFNNICLACGKRLLYVREIGEIPGRFDRHKSIIKRAQQDHDSRTRSFNTTPPFNIPASGRGSIHKFQDPYCVLEIHSFMKLTSAVKYLMAKKFYESYKMA